MPEPDVSRLTRRLTVASIGVAVTWAVLLLVWEEGPFALTFDDAFYYFDIARNLAEGNGSTFDGLNSTNGYHPLWMAVCVVPYLLGLDDMAAVRALLVFQVACYGGALVVIASAVTRSAAGWPKISDDDRPDAAAGRTRIEWTVVAAWVLLVGNPYVLKIFVNGLESGISVLLYALLLVRFLAPNPRSVVVGTTARWQLGTGLLLAVVFLARTDAIFAVGVLGLWSLAELRRTPAGAVASLARVFGPTAVCLVLYVASNLAWFDTPLQVSGLHKRAELDALRLGIVAITGGLAVLVGVRTWRRAHPAGKRRRSRFPRVSDLTARTGWFASFCLVLVAYYNGLQTQQWLWYYAPIGVLLLFVVPMAVADMGEGALAESPTSQSAGRAMVPVQAILLVPLVLALAVQVPRFTDPDLRSIQLANRSAGRWIADELPADAVLASWDAGVVGYFADRPVVNIDGVVNSYEFYEATQAGSVGDFLAADGVGYLVNHGQDDDGEDLFIRPWLTRTFDEATAVGARVVHRQPFAYSGTTTGSGGRQSGSDSMAVFVYELPQPLPAG